MLKGMGDSQTSAKLLSLRGINVLPQSLFVSDGAEFGFAESNNGAQVAVLAPAGSPHLTGFEGDCSSYKDFTLLLGPTSAHNAATLRNRRAWLRPRTLGPRTSVGMGDRLGLATRGHVRAVRAVGCELAPIFAQQSIREMERTGRSAQQVMDDATWGVFAEGWGKSFGADADHLKTPEDIDLCVTAGYTFFTFDPGGYVDHSAESFEKSALSAVVEQLPWAQLEDSPKDMDDRYLSKSFEFEGHKVVFDKRSLYQAAAKYGNAIAHTVAMYRHLMRVVQDRDFEVEISVDETQTPTTHAQHVYIARELQRLGVRWASLAPRYVGRFEKGVDFIGDIGEFENDLMVHAAIARCLGPYKLSLHSGSDKFSIYEAAARQTQGLVHLKTAGTSYLEALRTIAALDPPFFREIYAFARNCYEEDRRTYHVSASLDNAPLPQDVDDVLLPNLLDQFDAREILHVTFGSVLRSEAPCGSRRQEHLMELLRSNSEAHAANLESHFLRHLQPFCEKGSP